MGPQGGGRVVVDGGSVMLVVVVVTLCGGIAGYPYSTRPPRQGGATDPRATPPEAGWFTRAVRAQLRYDSTRARTGPCVGCSIPRRPGEKQERQNQTDDAHVTHPCQRRKGVES